MFHRPMWYGLDGQPITMEEAHALLGDINRRQLARTHLVTARGTVEVSTVFLVHDHNWTGGPPILWETMVFAGEDFPLDQHQWRYHTRDEAAKGHADAVTWARAELDVKRIAVLADETVGMLVAD